MFREGGGRGVSEGRCAGLAVLDCCSTNIIYPSGRASVSRGPGEGAQWKMVAGEMVDILKSVRHDGRVGKQQIYLVGLVRKIRWTVRAATPVAEK